MLDKVEKEKARSDRFNYSSIYQSLHKSFAAFGAGQSLEQDIVSVIIDAITERPKEEIVKVLQKAIEMLGITHEEDLDKIIPHTDSHRFRSDCLQVRIFLLSHTSFMVMQSH